MQCEANEMTTQAPFEFPERLPPMPLQVLTPKDWGDDRTSKREKDGEGREKMPGKRGKKKREKHPGMRQLLKGKYQSIRP